MGANSTTTGYQRRMKFYWVDMMKLIIFKENLGKSIKLDLKLMQNLPKTSLKLFHN